VFVIKPMFDIFDELTGEKAPILMGPVLMGPDQLHPHVWIVATTIEGLEIEQRAYLRVVFHTEDTIVEVAVDPSSRTQLPLAKWIDQEEILFVGWDRSDQIVAFARVAAPAPPLVLKTIG
jgi:hypothetical protein